MYPTGEVDESGRDVAGEGTNSQVRKGKSRAVNDSDVFELSDHRRSVEEDGETLSPRQLDAPDVGQASASEIEEKSLGNETPFSAQDTNTEGVAVSSDLPSTSTSRRHRTVFDQLQSHLSKATYARKSSHPILRRHELTIGNERSERRLDESFQPSVAAKPALLDRLSDPLAPIPSQENGCFPNASHDKDGVDHVKTPDHMEINKSRQTIAPTSSQVAHTTGPGSEATRETMLQLLNVASESGNWDPVQKQCFNGIDGVSATVKSPTLTSSSSSHSTTPGGSFQESADNARLSSSLRENLLTRLENERRLRKDNTSSSAAQDEPSVGATPPHPGDKISSSNSSSSYSDSASEAKRRSQALLRARLAVEKQRALDNHGDQCLDPSDQEKGRRSSLDLSERELRLKIQLRKARG